MAGGRFDLHAHTTASDGMLSARELVALAADRGLAGIAITDHDTTDGVDEGQATAQLVGVECIAGIELSCSSDKGGAVHLLGYFIDPANSVLAALVERMRQVRIARAEKLVALINEATGKLTMDEVLAESRGRAPGRSHIARAMVRTGVVADSAAAFSLWLSPGGRAHVRHESVPLAEGIAAIHAAGGAAVLAHPGLRARQGIKELAVREGAAVGLDGIEVDHPDHTEDAVMECVALARELDLVQTSGSDDHGTGVEGPRLGCRTVGVPTVDALRARVASRTQ